MSRTITAVIFVALFVSTHCQPVGEAREKRGVVSGGLLGALMGAAAGAVIPGVSASQGALAGAALGAGAGYVYDRRKGSYVRSDQVASVNRD